MARTKPKPRVVQITGGLLGAGISFYDEISVGDVLFIMGENIFPLIPMRFLTEITGMFVDEKFYLANVTKELYDYIKSETLTDNDTYINGFDVGTSIDYIAVLKNARLVEFRSDTGSGGTPASGAFTATEGDGIVILHKSASTDLTGSVDSNNWTTLVWPSTGIQSFYHQRNGGSAGSFTPPSLTPATQTGAWNLRSFYFESAAENEPIFYTGPYIVESRLLAGAGSRTAYLPSQTEVGDLVVNVHSSATAVPTTPTGWTSLASSTAIPAFDMYYKYITNIDTDDSFTNYGSTDLLYTAQLGNVGTGTFLAGSVTTTITTGSVGSQPTITSMENTQPYQLGYFVGIQQMELGGDDVSNATKDMLIMDSTNGWKLDNSLPAPNNFGAQPARISMAVSTYDAVEEQVLPPSQMAYTNTLEALGTALSTTYPSVAINFLVKNNQQ
jgi:hypothetical protein